MDLQEIALREHAQTITKGVTLPLANDEAELVRLDLEEISSNHQLIKKIITELTHDSNSRNHH